MIERDGIVKMPITYAQRRKNMLGPLIVECEVSSRYLKFDKHSSISTNGEFIHLDVMSNPSGDEGKSRKLCELIVTREDILEALKNIVPRDN